LDVVGTEWAADPGLWRSEEQEGYCWWLVIWYHWLEKDFLTPCGMLLPLVDNTAHSHVSADAKLLSLQPATTVYLVPQIEQVKLTSSS